MSLHMIGNAHLDPVWLWQWPEGYSEIKATFLSALDRLDEHPGFIFTCACAAYYEWVEQNAPELFERVRARIREGRWHVVGGMWIQPDMNVPQGESIARHLLRSQRYFREKFGITVRTGYNVDTFGHNAMLPQILLKAGMDSYVWMRPGLHENPDIPQGPMIWQGSDGEGIMAFRIHGEYTCFQEVGRKIEQEMRLGDELGKSMMCFYGVGNHGGGPTIQNLAEIDAFKKENARGDEVCYSAPDLYFRALEGEKSRLPVWKGELQHHASGCYSAHSASKALHRLAEHRLLRMEALGVLSRLCTGHEPRRDFVRQAWDNLMFNEFHDIMGGCALPEALEDACTALSESVSIAAREENAAIQRISWGIDTMKEHPSARHGRDFTQWGVSDLGIPVVVFNPHGFEARGEVKLRRTIGRVTDESGHEVACQRVRATRTNGEDKWDGIFTAQVPALGWRLYWVWREGQAEAKGGGLEISEYAMENQKIAVRFDPATGAMVSLLDKASGKEALSGPAQARLMDVEHCDTWAHGVFHFDREAGVFEKPEFRIVERGPVRAVLRITTRFGGSLLRTDYILYDGADQLEMQVKLDFHEPHRMVKLCFPVAGQDHKVHAEIPFGALERKGVGEEDPCLGYVSVGSAAGGLMMFNDGRYSYSVEQGELRMTIAHSAIFADHYGQKQRDQDCLFMDQGEMVSRYALRPFGGSWRDQRPERRAALLNRPLPHVVETYHPGELPERMEGIRLSESGVMMEAIKRSEDGQGYILRLSERDGKAVAVKVCLSAMKREFEAGLEAFEIKTLYIPDQAGLPVKNVLITEWEA